MEGCTLRHLTGVGNNQNKPSSKKNKEKKWISLDKVNQLPGPTQRILNLIQYDSQNVTNVYI